MAATRGRVHFSFITKTPSQSAAGGEHPLQKAFAIEGGAQCGFCTPGMILAALRLPPKATREQMKVGLAGNLCRCTGYEAIYRAIQKANASRQGAVMSDATDVHHAGPA